jgi:hypothetical protein
MNNNFNYWDKLDELSIFQALSLLIGYDPKDHHSSHVENSKKIDLPDEYISLKNLLINAVKSGKIRSELVYEEAYNGDYLSIDSTFVYVESLKSFLIEKGIKSDFFFPDKPDVVGYLNPNHSNFSSKLFAAIEAWSAISKDKNSLNGQTPKKAIEKYLKNNAEKLGLLKNDGSINITAVEEICKICNWKPEGGAAKTLTRLPQSDDPPIPQENRLKLVGYFYDPSEIDWDNGEIPF